MKKPVHDPLCELCFILRYTIDHIMNQYVAYSMSLSIMIFGSAHQGETLVVTVAAVRLCCQIRACSLHLTFSRNSLADKKFTCNISTSKEFTAKFNFLPSFSQYNTVLTLLTLPLLFNLKQSITMFHGGTPYFC